jgi:hypothetical protein
MTPKEKAKELVYKYFSGDDLLYEDLTWIQAKQCAIIAVDEILNYDIRAKCESQFVIEQRIESYWQEVKQEIEKL